MLWVLLRSRLDPPSDLLQPSEHFPFGHDTRRVPVWIAARYDIISVPGKRTTFVTSRSVLGLSRVVDFDPPYETELSISSRATLFACQVALQHVSNDFRSATVGRREQATPFY